MSNLDVIFKVPLSGAGLILPLSFPQALNREFRVHWRGGPGGSARTGLRWSPGPMNSFFSIFWPPLSISRPTPGSCQSSLCFSGFNCNNRLLRTVIYVCCGQIFNLIPALVSYHRLSVSAASPGNPHSLLMFKSIVLGSSQHWITSLSIG